MWYRYATFSNYLEVVSKLFLCRYSCIILSIEANHARNINSSLQGRIQDFKLGGAHLKKLRRKEGGAKWLGHFVCGAPPWIRPCTLLECVYNFPSYQCKNKYIFNISVINVYCNVGGGYPHL